MAKFCGFVWLFGIFILSLTLNFVGLSERLVSDFGWHVSIAKEVYMHFPELPERIPLMRQGVDFIYPPISHFIAAMGKYLFPDVRLIVIMRYIVVFFASASILPVYLLAKQAFKSERIGLFSAFLFALSPTHIAYYQYAQSVALPLVLMSLFFVIHGINTGSRKAPLVGGILLGAGYWTHLGPSLFLSALLLLISLFHIIRREYQRIISPLLALSVAIFFLFLYLVQFGLISAMISLTIPSRFDTIFIPERFLRVWLIGYSQIAIVLLGLAGAVLSTRARYNNVPMVLFLLSSGAMSLAGGLGFYLVMVPLSYVRYLIVPLTVFGGFALHLVLAKCRGRMQLFFAVFVAYSFYIAAVTSGAYVGLSAQDRTAFSWLHENLEPGAVVVADNGHSFWLPSMANVSTINGRKLDEFKPDTRDFDVATIFASRDADSKIAVMAKYGAHYVFYSDGNSTLTYPRTTMEDRWGRSSAWAVWANSASGIPVFEEFPFRKVYSDYRPAGANYDNFVVVYEI